MIKDKTAAIIGSGFGGLTLAIRLQSLGYHVTIFEKNDQVGGHASQLKKEGYTFDMGPSIITAPSIIQEVFACAGKTMEDYVDLEQLDPFYRVYYHDGTHIDYSGDPNKMKQQLRMFSAKDAEAYDAFQAYSKQVYDLVIHEELGSKPFDSWKDLLSFIPDVVKHRLYQSNFAAAQRYFSDFRSQFLFSFHPLFLGGNPFTTSAIFSMIPYLEREEGVLYARGGMYALVQAFERVFTELGGQIRCNHPIDEITIEDGRSVGVRYGDKKMPFNIVVSNAHAAHTYKDLIDQKHRKHWTDQRVASRSYSMSCLVLYFGLNRQYSKLLHHTIILSERYRGLVRDIFKHETLPDDFSIYAHAPSRTDPSMAPEGHESLYMLIPTPNLSANIDWKHVEEPFTNKIIDFLENDFGLEGFRDSIVIQDSFTPLDFSAVRNNYLGACWSLEPKLSQIGTFRPHNRSQDIENLYFVGASTHPGAGVPGVMLSAKATQTAILEDANGT